MVAISICAGSPVLCYGLSPAGTASKAIESCLSWLKNSNSLSSEAFRCATPAPADFVLESPVSTRNRTSSWNLLAAHVRSNHVHAIVEAEIRPEKILNEFKSYASRELNRLAEDRPDRRR